MMLRATAALWLLLFAAASGGADVAEKRYPLGDHGTLVMMVPQAWAEDVRRKDNLPPTVFYSPAGKQQVMVTPLWRPRPDMPPFSRESVRQNVEQGLKAIRSQAAEKDIAIVEFKGKGGAGWYYDATDKAPKPGEFITLRQGMLILSGELVLWFTILTNDRKDPALAGAMRMLQGATHAPR
jgi:hypothetical protein